MDVASRLVDRLVDFITNFFRDPYSTLYILTQTILAFIFAPSAPPPDPDAKLHRRRVAVIGAGLTGVAAASHCVGHGFDVKIFESRSKEDGLGGIWSVSLPFATSILHLSTRIVSNATSELASKFHICLTNPQYHVQIPSHCAMGQRLSQARPD